MRRQFLVATIASLSLLAACGAGTESGSERTRNVVNSISPSVSVLPGETLASTSGWNIRPTSPLAYTIVGMGDSFGSGEGNPVFGNGNWENTKWLNRSNDPEDATDCHRSGESGFYKALRQLGTSFNYIQFEGKNFACTGAVIGNLISRRQQPNTRQNRADRESYPPQVSQVDRWVSSLPRSHRAIDALYLSIGGNNAGFSDGIAECILAIGDFEWGCLGARNETMRDIRIRVSKLGTNYNELRRKINSSTFVPRNIVISTYPNFVKNENGQWCETDDWPLGMVTSEEWQMLWETMGVPLNNTIRTKARSFGWRVAEMETRYEEHVLCDSADDYNPDYISAWVNDDQAASNVQGNDFDKEGKGFLSMGMVHPNDAGYESYASAIVPELTSGIASQSTAPGVVGRFTVTRNNSIKDASGNIQMKFSWNPPAANGRNWAKRSGYEISLTTDIDGSSSVIKLGEGNTYTGFVNPKYHKFAIAPCGQPLSTSGQRFCGNKSAYSLSRPINLTPSSSAFTTSTVQLTVPTTAPLAGRG